MTRVRANTLSAPSGPPATVGVQNAGLHLLFAVLAGLFDPLYGVLVKLLSIFLPARLPDRADTPARRRRGLTLIVGGIEGPSVYNRAMGLGVLASGYRGAVVRFDWNAGIPLVRSLVNLVRRSHHRRHADRLAEIISRQVSEHPDGDVCLLAQSGGCWIVVKALERLEPDVRVKSAVLLAPSISPAYDPSPAAARCRDGLVSIGGPGDFFFLGIGTILLGTSDRVFGPSAGWIGWHHHPPGFVEARWHPRWIRLGYLGNHTTSSSRAFIRHLARSVFASSPPQQR